MSLKNDARVSFDGKWASATLQTKSKVDIPAPFHPSGTGMVLAPFHGAGGVGVLLAGGVGVWP